MDSNPGEVKRTVYHCLPVVLADANRSQRNLNRFGPVLELRKKRKKLDLFVTTTQPLRSPSPFNMSFLSTFLEDAETYSYILKDGEPFYPRQESKIPELGVILREKFPKVKRAQQCAPIATKSPTLPTRCWSELFL